MNDGESVPVAKGQDKEPVVELNFNQGSEKHVFDSGSIWNADNLDVMRGMKNASVDLIYLDPPFKKMDERKGNMKSQILDYLLDYIDFCYKSEIREDQEFATKAEAYLYDLDLNKKTNEIMMVFNDAWEMDDEKANELNSLCASHNDMYKLIQSVSDDSTRAYMTFMGVRIIEMHRILKSTGSIYVHCDQDANAYIGLLMDAVFGIQHKRNEIVWSYRRWPAKQKNYQKMHDYILFYTKSNDYTFNVPYTRQKDSARFEIGYTTNVIGGVTQLIVYDEEKAANKIKEAKELNRKIVYAEPKETQLTATWTDISILNSQDRERLGYPTQKPIALLNRMLKASSNEDDRFFDPFAGCATSAYSAYLLNRKWQVCDLSFMSVILLRLRLWLIQTGRLPNQQSDLLLKYPYTSTKTIGKMPIPDLRLIPTKLTAKQKFHLKMKLFGEQRGVCRSKDGGFGCGKEYDFKIFEMDHIVPPSKGGEDIESNFQILCSSCNKSKGDKI